MYQLMSDRRDIVAGTVFHICLFFSFLFFFSNVLFIQPWMYEPRNIYHSERVNWLIIFALFPPLALQK